MEAEIAPDLDELADVQRARPGPLCVGYRCQTSIQCTDHWYQMTPNTDDEWNWKHPLGCLVWQMDTDLPLGLGV